MRDTVADIVVIGAGIVGLATAMKILHSHPHLKVVVLEKESAVAQHQSSHNSGVIHSGIYYRPGSLKAKNCVSGAAKMVAFCQSEGIPYELCGKVIVATNDKEGEGLQELIRRGHNNGVSRLQLLNPAELREKEPHCTGVQALFVPSAGITDYSKVALKYAEIIQRNGGEISTSSEVKQLNVHGGGVVISTEQREVRTSYVINCAGLYSDVIMRLAGEKPDIRIIPFRGEYFELRPDRAFLIKSLIYPLPDPRFPFLGVHFTKKVQGGVEAGPNAVLALAREGYAKTDVSARELFDTVSFTGFWRMAAKYWSTGLGEYFRSFSKNAFARALQTLVPEIRAADLIEGGSGVRAQALDRSGNLLDDFHFVTSKRLIHVCNVPSPAATASLVIGEQIAELAGREFALRR